MSAEVLAGTVESVEGIPLTIGLAIFLIVLVGGIVGTVWTIATIRANDKENLQNEIKDGDESSHNAINRAEKKADNNHDVLHGRVNKLMEQDAEMQYKIGYMEGKQDSQEKFLLALMAHVTTANNGN